MPGCFLDSAAATQGTCMVIAGNKHECQEPNKVPNCYPRFLSTLHEDILVAVFDQHLRQWLGVAICKKNVDSHISFSMTLRFVVEILSLGYRLSHSKDPYSGRLGPTPIRQSPYPAALSYKLPRFVSALPTSPDTLRRAFADCKLSICDQPQNTVATSRTSIRTNCNRRIGEKER